MASSPDVTKEEDLVRRMKKEFKRMIIPSDIMDHLDIRSLTTQEEVRYDKFHALCYNFFHLFLVLVLSFCLFLILSVFSFFLCYLFYLLTCVNLCVCVCVC